MQGSRTKRATFGRRRGEFYGHLHALGEPAETGLRDLEAAYGAPTLCADAKLSARLSQCLVGLHVGREGRFDADVEGLVSLDGLHRLRKETSSKQ